MKAFTFSLIFLVLISMIFLLLYFSHQFEFSYVEEKRKQFEILELERFLNFVRSDFENFLEISIARALSSIISYEIENGKFIDDVNLRINELFFNASLFSNSSSLMQDSNFNYYLKRINLVYPKINVKINSSNITLKHFDSFTIIILINISIQVERDETSLQKYFEIKKKLKIIGFEDPWYVINTFGKASNQILFYPYLINNFTKLILIGNGNGSVIIGKSFVSNDANQIINLANKNEYILVTNSTRNIQSVVNNFKGLILNYQPEINVNVPYLINSSATTLVPNNTLILLYPQRNLVYNVENLVKSLQNQYCFPSLEGASFLDRLEGRFFVSNKFVFENNTIGLECLINKDYLIQQGIFVDETRTNIDYLYFSNFSITSYKIAGFENFYLDDRITINNLNHLQFYQVENLIE